MSVLNIFQYKNVCVFWNFQNVRTIHRPDWQILQTSTQVASGCKGSFCHCKNPNYL